MRIVNPDDKLSVAVAGTMKCCSWHHNHIYFLLDRIDCIFRNKSKFVKRRDFIATSTIATAGLDSVLIASCNSNDKRPACSIDMIYGGRWGDFRLTQAEAITGYPAITVAGGVVYALHVGILFFGSRDGKPVL